MLMSKNTRLERKVILDLQGTPDPTKKISAWAPNGEGDLTRVPMFGKSLPFSNDTSSCR